MLIKLFKIDNFLKRCQPQGFILSTTIQLIVKEKMGRDIGTSGL